MDKNIKFCTMIMKEGPRYPGMLHNEEGDERILTAQYKCLQTANAVGPDNNVVRPDLCQSGRGCFKSV
jgi:hypothetical protein